MHKSFMGMSVSAHGFDPKRKSLIEILCIVAICSVVLVLIGSLIASPIVAYSTKDQVTVTVTKTERVVTSENSYYLIFSDDEVLSNEDTLWYWKWNSSDVYGKIQDGKTYRFTVYGWRVPFLSWYRNIIDYEEIPPVEH